MIRTSNRFDLALYFDRTSWHILSLIVSSVYDSRVPLLNIHVLYHTDLASRGRFPLFGLSLEFHRAGTDLFSLDFYEA